MESMEAIIARINEQESRITLLEHRLSPPMVTAEPAPGSDAEHPPVGYRLIGETVNGKAAHCLYWNEHNDEWETNSDFIAVPIPANEGDSRLAESVAIPVGWVLGFPEDANFRYWCKDEKGGGFWTTTARTCVTVRDLMIVPDPSIPWGGGHEAILPSEAVDGDEFLIGSSWIRAISLLTWSERERNEQPWRRRIPATTPTEPARDLSDKIAESVVQDLQQACYDRDELRATVERLEAELETTKRFLAESLVVGDRLEEWQEAGLTASMMWDVIQEMRKTLDCDGTTTPVERAERVMRTIDELRATAERLEAENAELRGELTAEKSKLRILKSEYSELETVIATVRKALG